MGSLVERPQHSRGLVCLLEWYREVRLWHAAEQGLVHTGKQERSFTVYIQLNKDADQLIFVRAVFRLQISRVGRAMVNIF